MRDTALRGAAACLLVARRVASWLPNQQRRRVPVLGVRNIAWVVSNMTSSDELHMPGITAKKTLELKVLRRSELAPGHA